MSSIVRPDDPTPGGAFANRTTGARSARAHHPGWRAMPSERAGSQAGWNRQAAANVASPVARYGHVDAHLERSVAVLPGAVDELRDQTAIAPHIELEPEVRVTRRGDSSIDVEATVDSP